MVTYELSVRFVDDTIYDYTEHYFMPSNAKDAALEALKCIDVSCVDIVDATTGEVMYSMDKKRGTEYNSPAAGWTLHYAP